MLQRKKKVIVNKPSGYSLFTSPEYNFIYPSEYVASSKTVNGIAMNMFTSGASDNLIVTAEPKNIFYDFLTAELSRKA